MSKSSRRAFLGRLGTAAVVPALGSLSSSAFSFSAPAVASAEQGAPPGASYDLLIAGGRVIDPGQNLSAVRDVAILHGRVARIAENIPHTQARSVFDATDKIVTPGLIDLHSHVYEHGTPLGVNSDRVGIEAGVTTIVDCGTAGAAMFPGFRKFVIEGARTRIYALLNISTAGCCTDEIYLDPRLINIDAARAVIAEHRDLILGLKVRVRGRHEDLEHDISVMTTARELADEMGIPIMMHWSIEPDLLAILKRGDILTHPFNPVSQNNANVFGAVLPTEPGMAEVVADKGYHSNETMVDLAAVGVRSYIAEPDRGRRCWKGAPEARDAVYANRRRIRGNRGRELLRRRGELLERPFAHLYDTGGMRRVHLRGHSNILKRVLVHAAGGNLGLLLRHLIGVGTPRGLQGRVVSAVWALIRRLVGLWGGLERVLAPFLPDLPSTASLPRCQAFQPSI